MKLDLIVFKVIAKIMQPCSLNPIDSISFSNINIIPLTSLPKNTQFVACPNVSSEA